MSALDECLARAARSSLGLLTRTVILSLGGTDGYIREQLEHRRWQQLQAGVYLTGAAPPSWMQLLLAACLATGEFAVASMRSAAAVWWLDGANEGPVEITVAQPKGPRPQGVILHRTLRWDPIDLTVRRRVPVTSVNRTLIDYGAVAPRILVERAVEDAFRRGLTSEGALRRRLFQIGGPGCRGSGVLRAVLDGRPEGRPARSGFEVILLDVTRQFSLPTPVRNHPVTDDDGVIVAEADLAYPEQKVDLEANGAKWHSTARQRRRDAERRRVLKALGWTIVDCTWDEVIHHPELVAARIRAALCGLFVP